MKHIKYLTFLALSILGIAVLSGKAYAATDDEVTTLYNKDYQIIQGTSGFNPNYCSRMVWQAFYHGPGNKNVIQTSTAGLTYIFPGALVNTFTPKYRPYKVGTY